jgi:hypothetical protein
MYALIDISNLMLDDSAFDHAGVSLRKAGLAVAINEMLKRRSVTEWLRRARWRVVKCGLPTRNSSCVSPESLLKRGLSAL